MGYGYNIKERGAYTGERTSSTPFQTVNYVTTEQMAQSGFTMNRKVAIVRLVSQPNDADTITVGDTVLTFKTSPSVVSQIEIGNLLKEGTFGLAGAFWTNYGHWTIGSSKALHTAGTGYTDALEQNWFEFPTTALQFAYAPSPKVTAGLTYILGFTVADCTAGSVTPYIGNTAGTTRNANGTYAADNIIATNSDSLKFVPTATFDGSVSAITVTQVATDLKGLTALTLVNKINADQVNCKCSALYNVLGLGTAYVVLVAEDTGVTPALVVDGARVVKTLDFTLTLTEAYLDSTNYWKKNYTSDGDAKPVILVERNSGSWTNYLY